ncbi:hypothetical protein BWQ96_06457 [Gracilariopsis chorda]|uniref:Uncharacterized protein n=1 Tax=Gracilariopsis chorda TaxID=448386 RepID=A0A2V3IP23_9FLOR|nr:hypothetical protein BWQ96_06457 [Gracilariopsis chorda]|eukprot:PXF43836.1 hypothetical protein BWQ96_06457 [Gracilariopsis chorda]
MEQIRIRFQELLSIEKHSIRTTEHRTFSRLMYRNRNQHRHGFYFRKLEEVRRILRRIQQHVAWNSIRQAVTIKGIEKRKAPKNAPLALSSVTHDDIKSLETLYSRFVLETIPSAAIQVTNELVSRSHFLPFAVTMVSMLSRIYVLEKKILQELRGASLELGLLFSVQEQADPNNIHSRDIEGYLVEDVGTEVALLENDQTTKCSVPTPIAKEVISLPQTNSSTQIQDKTHDSVKLNFSESRTESESIPEPPTDDKNIYDLVSSKASEPQFPTMRMGRAKVSIPVSYKFSSGVIEQRDSQSNSISEVQTRKSSSKCRTVQEKCKEEEDGGLNGNGCLASDGKRSEMNQKAATVAPNQPAEESGSSDSEDLDDIFGALDD